MLGLSLSLSIGSCNAVPASGGGGTATLSLDFKNGVYKQSGTTYALTSLPGYAYSRTGAKAEPTATAVTSAFAANAPAIVSGLGYFSEGALTNGVLYSQDQTNGFWTKDGTSAAIGATAPDGTSTACTITESSGTAEHRVYQNFTSTTGTVTFSFFAKAGTRHWAAVRSNSATIAANFDLTNGVVGTKNAGTTATITALGSGWYYCTATGTGQVSDYCELYMGDADTGTASTYSYAGNGTGTIQVWNLQCVTAAVAGPIIATTGTAASVGADSMAMTVPNGTYSAVYTFADATTQTISTTVSGGTYTVPLFPATLNKSPLASVTLT